MKTNKTNKNTRKYVNHYRSVPSYSKAKFNKSHAENSCGMWRPSILRQLR